MADACGSGATSGASFNGNFFGELTVRAQHKLARLNVDYLHHKSC